MNLENFSEEDLYSDEEDINNYGDGMQDGGKGIGGLPAAQAERRAHHNALERKRRDHIKDSFTSLRESVPTLKGDKVKASRAQILKKAADYIGNLKSKNESCESDIEEILKQNKTLLETVRMIETRAQANGIPLPPTIKGELSSVSSSTSAIAGPVSQSLDNHNTTKKKTLCVTTTAMPQKSTGGTISALKRPATSIMSSTTSVISGGSGTVKLESHGKTITNPNKIFLVNSNYRTAGTADGRQVVIPTGGSRLITTNTIKNGVGTSTTTGQPIKIIIQSNAPQNVIKREH